MKVSKAGHVTREYEVTVGSEDVVQDVKICLLGDVQMDGDVDMEDVVALLNHTLKASIITDEYALKAGKVASGAELGMEDVVKILNYVLKAIDSLE